MFGAIMSVLNGVLAVLQVGEKVVDKVKPLVKPKRKPKKRAPRRYIDRDERPEQNNHARRH